MRAGRTLLQRPGCAAVNRCDNATVSTDGPTVRRVIGREGDRIEMIFRRRLNPDPALAAVYRPQSQSARANCDCALPIKNVQAVEAGNHTRALTDPLKAAVRAVQDHAVGPDRPTVTLVFGETNGVH